MADNAHIVDSCKDIVSEIKGRFEADYTEFIRDRKRWKSDFELAASSAKNNFRQIETLLTTCLQENKVCMSTLKMTNDVQMIS